MIFGIGLPKTGNTSLAYFLKLHGFNGVNFPSKEQWYNLHKYDYVIDTPCNIHYEELHLLYPDAKFIYTYRNEKDWIISWGKHLRRTNVESFSEWQLLNRKTLIENYPHLHIHKTKVQKYFNNTNAKLFFLDLDNLDVKGLCEFVGVENSMPYPHKNITPIYIHPT